MSDVPVLIRRTTMLVNDIEPSLQIYRDILGMSVHYDEEILVSGDGLPAGEPNSQTRLVMLKCKDDFIGMLGILQYIDPPLPEPPPRVESESGAYR
jgi:catechol 2,3-dioxygenase-like lactoylglutathione lyase family enzyme